MIKMSVTYGSEGKVRDYEETLGCSVGVGDVVDLCVCGGVYDGERQSAQGSRFEL